MVCVIVSIAPLGHSISAILFAERLAHLTTLLLTIVAFKFVINAKMVSAALHFTSWHSVMPLFSLRHMDISSYPSS